MHFYLIKINCYLLCIENKLLLTVILLCYDVITNNFIFVENKRKVNIFMKKHKRYSKLKYKKERPT